MYHKVLSRSLNVWSESFISFQFTWTPIKSSLRGEFTTYVDQFLGHFFPFWILDSLGTLSQKRRLVFVILLNYLQLGLMSTWFVNDPYNVMKRLILHELTKRLHLKIPTQIFHIYKLKTTLIPFKEITHKKITNHKNSSLYGVCSMSKQIYNDEIYMKNELQVILS